MAIDYFAQQFGEDVYENTAPPAPAFTDAQINEYVTANIGNPQAIADAAQQYGVSAADLSRATGYDAGTVGSYFSNAGIDFGQPADLAPVAAPVDYYTQQFQPDVYSQPTYSSTDETGAPIYNYTDTFVNNIQATPAYMGTAPDQGTPPAAQTPPPGATEYGTSADVAGPTGISSLAGASLGAGLPGTGGAPVTQQPPVILDSAQVQQNIIAQEQARNSGLPSLQATTPQAQTPPPPIQGSGTGTPIDANAKVVNDLYASIGRTGIGTATNQIDKGGFDYWKQMLDSGMSPDQVKEKFQTTVNEFLTTKKDDPYSQFVAPTQLKNVATAAFGNASLSPFERINKVLETGQAYGLDDKKIDAIFGKDVADKYRAEYGANIKDYITNTLGDKTKSDFDKVATINQTAVKYGLDADEIAKYSGLNKKGVDQMFTAFDTGLASIVKGLSAPTVSDLDKTKGALALQQKYSITDDQIAKALGGNITGKDVTAYLAPVKDFNANLQAVTSDPTKTARDLQAFVDNAKKDPRLEGLYGLALDKVQQAVPVLGLRDSIAGNGTPEQLVKGYTDFVAAVNSNPALQEKYGAQAKAIDQVAKLSQRIADEKYDGKLQPHMFQTFIGLDQKTIADIPKQLEVSKPETRTVTDNEGQTQTYTVPGQVKDTKGLEPVYNVLGSGEDQTQQLVGYTKPVQTSAGVTVDAQYDANGTLTGYRGRDEDKVWPQHRVGISGQWDADGKASPVTRVESPGVLKNMIQDVAALGPVGQLAIAFATSGLGSLAAGALTPALGATAAKVVASGIINGAVSEMGGGEFGKGFLTGAAGAGTNVLAQNYMPTINTGSAFADQYLTKALPNLATSAVGAAINKQDIGQAGISSLLNTGTNMATSSLINSAMPDTLTPEMQKMFTGVSGQLLSSLLQDKPIDLQKSIMNTIMQNAMSQGKTTAKEKG